MASAQGNLYAILGVEAGASEAEIRSAYKRMARKFHPDHRRSELSKLSNPQDYEAHNGQLVGAASFDEMFSLIARAHDVLGDPAKRAAYDLEVMGVRGSTSASRALGESAPSKSNMADSLRRLQELKRKDAELQTKLMAVTFDQRRKQELQRGGLVIDDAWYGASYAVREETTPAGSSNPGKHPGVVCNITRQLQCMVENSRLVLPKGESKCSAITGVFDPCPDNSDKSLFLRYFFKGRLHEVTIGDEEMLLAPVKQHLLATKRDQAGSGRDRSGGEEEEHAASDLAHSAGQGQLVPKQWADAERVADGSPSQGVAHAHSRLGSVLRFVAISGIVFGVGGSVLMASHSRVWLASRVFSFSPAAQTLLASWRAFRSAR